MTFNIAGMRNYRQRLKQGIRVASGELLPVAGYGDLHVMFLTDGRHCQVTLTKVAYVPKLCYNLFSLKAVTRRVTLLLGCLVVKSFFLRVTCRSRFAGTPTRLSRSGYRKWYQRTLQVLQSSPLVASSPHQQTSTLSTAAMPT